MRSASIDPWFIAQIEEILAMEERVREHGLPKDAENMRLLKSMGFSDARLGSLSGKRGHEVAKARRELGVRPVYKRIDTCAAEFASPTAYMYSTYETPFAGQPRECEARVSDREKVVILGGGPNRIGQGIEFDYCCCHAAFALRRGLRDDHGQLQPGNRVDRLRHLRPALFRAADRRRRARNPAHKEQERQRCSASSCSSAARPR
jgi:hypothetical protein